MGKVLAVCISEKKGTQKKNVGSAVFVEDWGLEGVFFPVKRSMRFVRRAQRSRMVLLVRTWLWKGLILHSFRLAPDFAVVRLCWN